MWLVDVTWHRGHVPGQCSAGQQWLGVCVSTEFTFFMPRGCWVHCSFVRYAEMAALKGYMSANVGYVYHNWMCTNLSLV